MAQQKRPGPVPVRLNAKQREALRDGRMPGESQQGALLRLGPGLLMIGSGAVARPIGPKAILERLAKIEANAQAAVPVGWEVPDELHPDLSDLALDVLGVQKDTYDTETDTGFSRDWHGDQWYRVVEGEITVEEFVRAVMSDAEEPNPSRG